MPELPEVELISRSLASLVSGRKIVSAELRRQRLAPGTPADEFSRLLTDVTIEHVHRRGKHILFDLSGGMTLVVHLRMSGRFSLLESDADDPKFTHAVFYLNGDDRLVFDDQRHFGFMRIVKTADLFAAPEIAKLAPEPFSDDFSPEFLYKVCRSSNRSLKELLLDQSKVCGLGNIYACEAMFLSGIDPRLKASRLSRPKAARLHGSIRQVLSAAIEYGLTRPIDPQDLEGGYFSGIGEDGWYVYDRENEPCTSCNNVIFRLKQGGRSTFYCRKCQTR